MIAAGRARAAKDGRQQCEMGAGDWFGEIALPRRNHIYGVGSRHDAPPHVRSPPASGTCNGFGRDVGRQASHQALAWTREEDIPALDLFVVLGLATRPFPPG
jgi:hypothetical protein